MKTDLRGEKGTVRLLDFLSGGSVTWYVLDLLIVCWRYWSWGKRKRTAPINDAALVLSLWAYTLDKEAAYGVGITRLLGL